MQLCRYIMLLEKFQSLSGKDKVIHSILFIHKLCYNYLLKRAVISFIIAYVEKRQTKYNRLHFISPLFKFDFSVEIRYKR